jgi:hypothetical protein
MTICTPKQNSPQSQTGYRKSYMGRKVNVARQEHPYFYKHVGEFPKHR